MSEEHNTQRLRVLQPTELRIGNYVHGTLASGSIYTPLMVHQISSGKDIDNAPWFFPIALTEEWLFKFGVKKDRLGELYLHDFSFHWNAKDNSFTVNSCSAYYTIATIKFVHQFQNFFYALTDEELILKS